MKKKFLQKITYSKAIYSLLFLFGIFLVYQYFRQKELIKNYTITKAIVTYIGQAPGVRATPNEFHYQYRFQNQNHTGTGELLDYKIEVGDSVYIKFSTEESWYSEPIYDSLKKLPNNN